MLEDQPLSIPETSGWTGRVRVIVRRRDGTLEVEKMGNLIVDEGLNLLRDVLKGEVLDGQIRFLAWGDGTDPPASGDSTLGNELGRKAVTQRTSGEAGVLTTTVYLSPYDANGQIEELGWFAGPDASQAPGSGVLLARVLYSRLKTDLESIQVDREDTIGVSM